VPGRGLGLGTGFASRSRFCATLGALAWHGTCYGAPRSAPRPRSPAVRAARPRKRGRAFDVVGFAALLFLH
jgi:hypothetical protein